MAHLLAKQGKLVTNGELIKSYLIAADEELCPEKINLFNKTRLLGKREDTTSIFS